MTELLEEVDSPAQIAALAMRVREACSAKEFAPDTTLETFERWSASLQPISAEEIPGVAFLRLWLRRGTLEPILRRELGTAFLNGGWAEDGRGELRAFPLGIIGHWPAGNVDIQPMLSMSCSLLSGNGCLVRVPSGLVKPTRRLIDKFREADRHSALTGRVALVSFDHSRADLNEAMARAVDGAMIWGGAEAVSYLRALPFPRWARIMVFGPRLSVAAMDGSAWNNPLERPAWCQRIARDVWQFDQQACSSPQTLFLENCPGGDIAAFVDDLKRAFEEENRAHPRRAIEPALASAICLARSTWLLESAAQRAVFPSSPHWTILVGKGSQIPKPTHGRTLHVLAVDDLMEPISIFDGAVQTMGLAAGDMARERALAEAAGRRGVDRIVKLGRMHSFGSPWDGAELLRPMVRFVRYVSSQEKVMA